MGPPHLSKKIPKESHFFLIRKFRIRRDPSPPFRSFSEEKKQFFSFDASPKRAKVAVEVWPMNKVVPEKRLKSCVSLAYHQEQSREVAKWYLSHTSWRKFVLNLKIWHFTGKLVHFDGKLYKVWNNCTYRVEEKYACLWRNMTNIIYPEQSGWTLQRTSNTNIL